ncbi:hypothetical protein [Phaeacidiphilus oryzae]|uniref:hypothetical protein n=1 Tax=Phaeacidiphilus oryzae TaxID=348818 RepID=UPI00068F79E1|nr:hypothetical protein [Phaeacidiphilus oryzae]
MIGEEVDPPLTRPYAPGPEAGPEGGHRPGAAGSPGAPGSGGTNGAGYRYPQRPATPPPPGYAPPAPPPGHAPHTPPQSPQSPPPPPGTLGYADPAYIGHQVHQPYAPSEPSEGGGGPRPGRGRLIALVALLVVLLGGGGAWAYAGLSGGGAKSRADATVPGNAPAASASGAPASAPPAASGSPSPARPSASGTTSAPASPGPGAAAAAQAVNALIDQSMSDRQQVVDAVAAVQQCVSPDSVRSAAEALGTAYQGRRRLIGRLEALDVSALPGGRASIADLQSAWQQSAGADQAFQAWARSAATTCSPNDTPQTGDFRTANQDSDNATAAKRRFVLSWNQIAAQYGLPSRTWDAI